MKAAEDLANNILEAVGVNKTIHEVIDYYARQSPVECWKLNLVAFYCLLLFIGSIIFNGMLLIVFYKFKELRTTLNIFVIVLTAINFFGSCVELPLVITTNWWCRWLTGKIGCFISGFIMYTIGTAGIYLFAAMSFERFIIIYRPMSIKTISFKNCYIISGVCVFLGAFWAAMPVFGWSYYSLEGALTSCSIEWHERSFNVVSYNVTIFIWSFALPLFIIIFANIKLILIIKSLPKVGGGHAAKEGSVQDDKAKKRAQNERQLTIIMITLTVLFVLSWTPYAAVAFYAAFLGDDLPPIWGTLPAMFAKSSMVWTSVVYIYSNKQIRVKIMATFFNKTPEALEVSMSRNKTAAIGQTEATSNV